MAKIIRNEINDYISINVANDETAWNAEATYQRGNIRRDGSYLYAYAGLNNTNSTLSPSNEPSKWVYMYPTNYYSMIDGTTSQKTVKIGEPLIFEVANDNRDSLSLLNVDATDITVEIVDIATSTVLYIIERNIRDESGVVDFFTYCFSDFFFKNDNYFELPLYGSNTKIRITIDNGSSDAAVGRFVFGRSFDIGEAEFSGTLSIESYSIKQTNEFGVTNLVQRESVNIENYVIRVPIEKVPTMKRKRKEYDAIPVLFVIDDNADSKLENLQTFGFWQTFEIGLTNKRFSTINLGIKGIL